MSITTAITRDIVWAISSTLPSVPSQGTGAPIIAYPTVTGDAIEGETLTVSDGTWSGIPDSFTYQWMRGDILVGGDTPIVLDGETIFIGSEEVIVGETTDSYLIRNEDAGYDGKDYVIWCEVTAVYGVSSYTVQTDATGPVQIATYAETTALLARMSVQPDSTRQSLINLTIGRLKYEGIWALTGFIHFQASHDSQADLLCWNNAAYNLTVNGTITRTTDRGRKGNGVDGYLATGIAPNALANYTQNAATIATWETDNVSSAAVALGLQSATTVQILGRNTSDNIIARVNIAAGMSATNTAADSRGLTASTRDGANSQLLYFNGVEVGTPLVTASTTPSSSPFTYLRSSTTYSTRRIGFGFAGGILTTAQHAALYAIVRDYMIAIGAA